MSEDLKLEFVFDDEASAKKYYQEFGFYVASFYCNGRPYVINEWRKAKNDFDQKIIDWCQSLPSYRENEFNIRWDTGWSSMSKSYFKKQSDIMLFKLTFS